MLDYVQDVKLSLPLFNAEHIYDFSIK